MLASVHACTRSVPSYTSTETWYVLHEGQPQIYVQYVLDNTTATNETLESLRIIISSVSKIITTKTGTLIVVTYTVYSGLMHPSV